MLRRATFAIGLIAVAQPAFAQFGPSGPPAVGVMTVAPRPVTETADFVGRVEATDRVELLARVTGFLQERLFKEGTEVKQGDVLFRLEKPPFEAELARARSTLASAEAEQANARINLGRARELLRTPAGQQSRVDDATASERTSAASVMGAQAQLRTAEINLGYTEITAPITGKIGRSNFAVGSVVGPSAGPLATIVSQDPMRVAFPVSARQALELRNRYESRGGADAVRIRIKLSDGRVYPHPGRIEFIDNQIDRNTDSILIRALIPNPVRQVNGRPAPDGDRELIDNLFVNVVVEGVQPVMALTVPRAAVLQDQQGSYVLVVDAEKKAQRRNIRLGRSTPETAVIEDGLKEGETVITEGIQRVRPGQEVNPAPAGAPPPNAGRQG